MRGQAAGVKGRHIKAVAIVLIALVLAGAVLLQYSLDGTRAAKAKWDRSGPFDSMRSFLNLLGGVRETLAAYLWTRTDTVFHEYVGADPAKEAPLYPYFWLITRLDTHFTMAYNFASWMLCRFGRVDEGFRLALEGVRYNPYSALLRSNLAHIYLFFKKDPRKARYHYLEAISLTKDEFDRDSWGKMVIVCDKVIAGEKSVPDVVPWEKTRTLNEESEKQESHEHH